MFLLAKTVPPLNCGTAQFPFECDVSPLCPRGFCEAGWLVAEPGCSLERREEGCHEINLGVKVLFIELSWD